MGGQVIMERRRPTAVDLFAGAGGLSLGLEQAGFDVLAAVEYDPVHAAVHAFNFPRTEILCREATTLSGEELAAAAAKSWAAHHGEDADWDGELDLIAGGPPCQGFSWIGKRRVDDERNDLIFHFWRLIHELRPRYFLMENVPGMMAGSHATLLADLLRRFAHDGYKVQEPAILNAADYGVPQDRRRLILSGAREDVTPWSYPQATWRPAQPVRGTRTTWSNENELPRGPTTWEAIGDLPNLDRFAALLDNDQVRLTSNQLAGMTKAMSEYARRLHGIEIDESDFSYPRAWDRRVLTSSMRTVHTLLSITRFTDTSPGSTEPVSRFLRLAPDGLCNTLRAGTGGERGAYTSPRPIHPKYPRVISVREAARLHSFPDWFRLHATKWHGFRQVGNAVPPLLGRALGRAIVEALAVSPSKPTAELTLGDPKLLWLSMYEAADQFRASRDAIPPPRRRVEQTAKDE